MKEITLPLFLFALTMTATPGPNNMILTASGALFGYRKSLPFIGGAILGIESQLILSALGLGVLFQQFPLFKFLLKGIGTGYILYLAFRIAFGRGKGNSGEDSMEKPIGFVQGALFQYLNPKAYLMTLTAMSVFPLEGKAYTGSALFVLGVFFLIIPFSLSLWAGSGSLLKRIMRDGSFGRKIPLLLGGMTAASALFILK